MESWLKNEKTKFLICIICALVGTIIVNYPYLFSSFLGIEHDTFSIFQELKEWLSLCHAVICSLPCILLKTTASAMQVRHFTVTSC